MNVFKDLVIIKGFIPEKIPEFAGTEPIGDFVKWNLYDRVASGLKSFVLLCDNRRFYDAFLVAGNVLETCAVFSYIKDKQTENERLKNLNKYLARSAAGQLIKLLSWDDNLKRDISWNSYVAELNIFVSVGASIIKEMKNGKTDAENHQEILDKLKCREGNNTDKKKLINSNYERPDPQGYVRAFSKTFYKLDNGNFEHMYDKYLNMLILCPVVLRRNLWKNMLSIGQ